MVPQLHLVTWLLVVFKNSEVVFVVYCLNLNQCSYDGGVFSSRVCSVKRLSTKILVFDVIMSQHKFDGRRLLHWYTALPEVSIACNHSPALTLTSGLAR